MQAGLLIGAVTLSGSLVAFAKLQEIMPGRPITFRGHNYANALLFLVIVAIAWWQISTEGGMAPIWARTGRELFYLDASNTLMTVSVDTSGPRLTFGRPAKLLDTKYAGNFYSYDVTPDGRRFLTMKNSTADGPHHARSMVLVLNWFEEVRRRVPAR